MQLTALSLALTRVGLGGFAPSSLFLYGEQGAWYDPSDISRYMSQLGPELRSFFTYSTSGRISSYSYTDGAESAGLTWDGVSVDGFLRINLEGLAAGKWYAITIQGDQAYTESASSYVNQVRNGADAQVVAWSADQQGQTQAVTQYFVSDGANDVLLYSRYNGLLTYNISVRELTALGTATMFQDSAGTTPVTAVEQPVGLILDKSKGLVLGPELAGVSTWGATSAGVIKDTQSGTITFTGSQAAFALQVLNSQNAVIGSYYAVEFTVSGATQGGVQVRTGGVQAYVSGNGVYRFIQRAVSETAPVAQENGGLGSRFNGTLSNISVRELPGNHAFQTTTTSRPVLSARYNLLTKTEQLDDTGVWARSRVSVVSNIISVTTAGQYCGIRQGYATVNGTFEYSVWAKGGTSGIFFGTVSDNVTAGVDVYFNLDTGAVGAQIKVGSGFDVVGTPSISGPDVNGFRKCSFTVLATGSKPVLAYVSVADADGSPIASVGKTIVCEKASLVPTNQASLPYQRVNTSTDYDADPAKFPVYLRFDGVDDWLQTNSIDFTATDKMTVFAGVRKLSDAAIDVLAEIGPSNVTSNGSWGLQTVGIVPDQPVFTSRGTVRAPSFAVWGVSPRTGVLTGTGDISGDLTVLRANGNQIAQSTADQGTGNFGNYPLYIGRRGGVTNPFNGQLYSLIVRGAQTSDTQIAQTETWVNGKTKAY